FSRWMCHLALLISVRGITAWRWLRSAQGKARLNGGGGRMMRPRVAKKGTKFHVGKSGSHVKSGPLSTPREHGPDLTPSPNSPRSGPHSYSELRSSAGAKVVDMTNCSGS